MRLQVGQNSGCFTREWQTEWSWLKLMRSPRAAEKRRIGIEIRPNVMWPFQTVEAMTCSLDVGRARNCPEPISVVVEASGSKIKLTISNEIRSASRFEAAGDSTAGYPTPGAFRK